MELKKILKIILILGFVLIGIDQISKIFVNILIKTDLELIPNNILVFTKVNNEGIAFGINKKNFINIIITILILSFIFSYLVNQKDKMTNRVVVYLTLIISGGLSNLLDRVIRGSVFDFIGIGEFPVFNFADICIVFGWILFSINFFKYTAVDLKSEFQLNKKK